jgi:V/A-type H+-transporting ATPase subunit F
MRRGRLVAIGPADTVLGLGLLGIEGTVVEAAREAAVALDEAMASRDVAIVLLSEAWSGPLHDRLENAALDEQGPLIVEIPDPEGENEHAPLAERVEDVLGVRLTR